MRAATRGPRRWSGVVALLMAVAVIGSGHVWAQAPPALQIEKVDSARFTGAPDQPVFVLVVGSDARVSGPLRDSNHGDALHLIGVNPAAASAVILNIPRDTSVPIPGHGSSKINDALQFGGPRLQAEAVKNLTGAQPRFVVTTRFEGFRSMVDELGGVDVNVPFAMNDSASGAKFPQGPRHMNGNEALAFARNRHVPDGDLRRSEHQALLIIAGLAKLRAQGSGPTAAMRYLSVLARHASIEGVGLMELYRFGRLGLSLDPARVRQVTMPSIVGPSLVHAAPSASRLFADFRDDAILQAH
jgi:LCP family protein required for cell wall assembly